MSNKITKNTMPLFLASLALTVCKEPEQQHVTHNVGGGYGGSGGVGGGNGPLRFKVPVPQGYDWEVSQSWAEHCEGCSQSYGDWDYCGNMSHQRPCCEYSWDFNLPGYADRGKPVLASADGWVEDRGYTNGWGNYIVVDHGGGICTRYAHMENGSTDHIMDGEYVCQGLQLGNIDDTGFADGAHLHFQFEDCGTGATLEMGFSDGNGVPVCTRGRDRFDASGNYNFLRLTNELRTNCYNGDGAFGSGRLPQGGWLTAGCGSLPGCPLIPNCGRSAGHEFSDYHQLTERTAQAAAYLWSECAIDGYRDGGLHPYEMITRAEALKVPMYLFGLMSNCGSEENFEDVDSEDWYFPVVACAVRHGILDTIIPYFNPNEEITFFEAAKFIVEAAATAGVIEIQDPPVTHFENVPVSHWAHPYVETLYIYGGLVSNSLRHSPSSRMERREYVIMAASLSPCFCSNVVCEGGCSCEQATFACNDPDDESSGSGGGSGSGSGDSGSGSSDDSGDGTDGESDDEEDISRIFDLEIDCETEEDETTCEGGATDYHIRCGVNNNGDSVVRINNLVMSLEDDFDGDCEVTDPDLRSGVGTQNVDAGEGRSLTGEFAVRCESRPDDGLIEVVFDLIERVAGVNTEYEDLLATEVELEECEPEETEEPAYPDWCDPETGYSLTMYSPGGSFEIISSGPTAYLAGELPVGMEVTAYFDCIDLPAAILIHTDPEGVIVDLEDEDLPDFGLWIPYFGELTLDPGYAPDFITDIFASTTEDLNVLVRIPPE